MISFNKESYGLFINLKTFFIYYWKEGIYKYKGFCLFDYDLSGQRFQHLYEISSAKCFKFPVPNKLIKIFRLL